MRFIFILLFIIFSASLTGQIKTKHHLGFSLGIDPASAISIMLEDDTDEYNDEMDEGNSAALNLYYKFKPHNKWDFDGGLKMAFTGSDKHELFLNESKVVLSNRSNIAVFTTANFSTRNVFSNENNTPFFTSAEIGYYWPLGVLSIYDNQEDATTRIEHLSGNFYVEGKIGIKAGWENNALGFYLAVNNMTYVKSSNYELKKRGLGQFSEIGGTILFGLSYEFGLRKKNKKKKQQTTYPDWFKPAEN